MTDEMRIQQRPSAMPYVGIGGALGAGAGYLVNKNFISKPMSHDDIIKKMNDADTFAKNTAEGAEHAASWKEVQEKAKAVEDAKAAVANAEKPVLPEDNKLAQQLKDIEGEYEKAISEKTAEKTVTKKTGSKIVPANDNWKMSVTERAEYEKLYTKWENAVNAFEADPKVQQLTTDIADRKKIYKAFYDDIITNAENEISATAKLRNKNNQIKNLAEYLEKGSGQDYIKNNIEKSKWNNLSNSELIKLGGGESKLVAKKPSGWTHPVTRFSNTYVPVTDSKGNKVFAEIQKNVLDNAKSQRTEKIYKDITETLEAYNTNTKKLNNLHENVKIDKSLLNQVGITQEKIKGSKAIEYKQKVYDPISNTWNKQVIDFKAFVENCETNAKQYADDAKLLFDKGVHNTTVPKGATAVTYAPEVQAILTKYSATSPSELYQELVAKHSIGNKFSAERATVEKAIGEILGRDTQLASLEGQMSNLRNGAKDIRNAESQIRGQFGKFLGKPGATTETVAGMTREEAIKALEGSDIAKRFADIKGKVETAAKEVGAVDQNKLNTAKEALTKAEGEFKSSTEALGKKLGKGGNKWLAIGIGAAALGLSALALRPKADA